MIFFLSVETILKEQIVKYVEYSDILSDFKAGYRKHYSCESALNERVFIDLKRVFETIDSL